MIDGVGVAQNKIQTLLNDLIHIFERGVQRFHFVFLGRGIVLELFVQRFLLLLNGMIIHRFFERYLRLGQLGLKLAPFGGCFERAVA